MSQSLQGSQDNSVLEAADITTDGTDTHRKAAAQAFVHHLVVVEPGVIQPTYLIRGGLPTDPADNPDQPAPKSASRAVTDVVVLTCHYTHTYPLVTGSPILLNPSNTVLRSGLGDR